MVRGFLVVGSVLIALGLASCQLPTGGADELKISYDDGQGNVSEWTLTCDPPGGTHPDPGAACRALAEHGEQALPPVPPDRACTAIYGGPQTARITGTWDGEEIEANLSRVNGCEIQRWGALEGLLPKP